MGLLQQQVEHNQLGLQDPKGLFQFSRASTKKSRQRALQQGRQHEKDVRQDVKPDNQKTIQYIDDVLDVLDLS